MNDRDRMIKIQLLREELGSQQDLVRWHERQAESVRDRILEINLEVNQLKHEQFLEEQGRLARQPIPDRDGHDAAQLASIEHRQAVARLNAKLNQQGDDDAPFRMPGTSHE